MSTLRRLASHDRDANRVSVGSTKRVIGARMRMKSRLYLFALASVGMVAWIGSAAVVAAEENVEKPYTVKEGKVDQHTYNGWRRYTESCLRCHGPDGAGSSYGPDLTQSLKSMSEEDFKEVVVNGRVNVSAASQNVMPPFGTVEDVMSYLDDIYAYLKARSDGVLDRGRPQRIGQT
jgi:mono/diheme cytochrome c family protein